MADNVVGTVSRINRGFEDHDLTTCYLDTIDATDQFLGLTRKHRTADHFDAATDSWKVILDIHFDFVSLLFAGGCNNINNVVANLFKFVDQVHEESVLLKFYRLALDGIKHFVT